MQAVLARGRWSVPEALAAGTRGPQAPLGVVLSAGVRVHPTLLVHRPLGRCLGPVAMGFAPGTQPMGRAGEYSVCCVVLCYVVLCCVVLCCVVLCCVVLCCVVLCCVVLCRRRCYQKAMAGMSTHGYTETGGLCV